MYLCVPELCSSHHSLVRAFPQAPLMLGLWHLNQVSRGVAERMADRRAMLCTGDT